VVSPGCHSGSSSDRTGSRDRPEGRSRNSPAGRSRNKPGDESGDRTGGVLKEGKMAAVAQ